MTKVSDCPCCVPVKILEAGMTELVKKSSAYGEAGISAQTADGRERGGLSADKTPEEYGAFPFDAYSHTPYNSGAKQPGMTGQVKEEIITRFGELGLFIKNGKIIFNPYLLKKTEFLK